MRILCADIGTGTQDILLFDTRRAVENGYKLVLPAPTMIVRGRIQAATRSGRGVVLTGATMGGGPSAWAAEDHARAGLPIFATPDAARSFNDDLEAVAASGIQVVSEDEAARLPAGYEHILLTDFDFAAIAAAFARFGVPLDGLSAVAVAVFDHGAAPREVSDRKFRFDYLDARLRAGSGLSGFAFRAEDVPAAMTRLRAVAKDAAVSGAPVIAMDTAPAAVLGALYDRQLREKRPLVVANVGNFHTLAFRLGEAAIDGVFEHHTGMLDRPKLEAYLRALADGSLTNGAVFADMGHGALVYAGQAMPLEGHLAVTGPRRALLAGSLLGPTFAVPFGDMMVAGCIGLLAACADRLPGAADEIRAALAGENADVAPWE
jgi:uncharacterized protein (DUF1786 family)